MKKKTEKNTIKKALKKQTANESAQSAQVDEISKNTKIIMGTFLIILVAFGIIFTITRLIPKKDDSILTSSNADYCLENGYCFVKQGNMWYTQLQPVGQQKIYNLELRYDPKSVQEVSMEESVVKTILSSQEVYLTVDPNMTGQTVIAMIELGRIIGTKYNLFNIPTAGALTSSDEGNQTIITCDDATQNSTVLWFKTGEETKIYKATSNPYCVIVQGTTEEDIMRAADRFVYQLVGILK